MSDSYDDYDAKMQLAESAGETIEARANFRNEIWTTKDGRTVLMRDMEDSHLFNAYRYSQNPFLFREMVLRLFEAKLKEKNA